MGKYGRKKTEYKLFSNLWSSIRQFIDFLFFNFINVANVLAAKINFKLEKKKKKIQFIYKTISLNRKNSPPKIKTLLVSEQI